MITTLEERKANLLSQIEKLKREIDGLKCLKCKEQALCNRMGSVRCPVIDRRQENSKD
jgi:hypothetical protein